MNSHVHDRIIFCYFDQILNIQIEDNIRKRRIKRVYKNEIDFLYAYLSAKTPAAADPVTMPAKCAVPTKANKYRFSLHVIEYSSTMVRSYLSYTQRLHCISFLIGSSRPHKYVEFPSGKSYRLHCSGVNSPVESVVPGTTALTHGSSNCGWFGSSQPGIKHLLWVMQQRERHTKQSI